jgi:hypothetical protein
MQKKNLKRKFKSNIKPLSANHITHSCTRTLAFTFVFAFAVTLVLTRAFVFIVILVAVMISTVF